MERFDDWSNPAAGLGSVRDKSVGLTFKKRDRIAREVLEAIYEQNPIAARLIDKKVDDALRHGWGLRCESLNPEELDRVYKDFKDMNVDQALRRWIKWGNLYGGAVLTLPVLDNADPLWPMDLRNVRQMLAPQVVSAHDARPDLTDAGFNSPTFGRTISYQISGIVSRMVDVHHSRVIAYEPVELPMNALLNAGTNATGWGPSILDRIFDDLGRDGAARSHAVAMMYIASILYLKIDGYRNAYKTREAKAELRQMIASIRRDLDSLGLLGMDAADEIGSVSLTMAGAYELIDRMRNALAAAADGMPKEILFNESQNSLNAGQLSGPQELWFGSVEAFRESVLSPALERLLEVYFAARGMSVGEYEIDWPALWTKSDTETSTTAKTNAETDTLYFTMGAASAEEIRRHRFEQGKTGPLELADDESDTPALDLSGEIAAYEQSLAPADVAPAVDITPALEIVKEVTAGTIPRDAGEALLAVAGFPASLLGSAGALDLSGEAGPSTEPPPGDLLSPRDAASQFGVPTRTITRRIELGELPYWGLGGHKRVSAAAVAALAKGHEEAPADDEAA